MDCVDRTSSAFKNVKLFGETEVLCEDHQIMHSYVQVLQRQRVFHLIRL